MARPNYSFERRQRDLAKKKKAEEKLARKIAKSKEKGGGGPPVVPDEDVPFTPPDSPKEA